MIGSSGLAVKKTPSDGRCHGTFQVYGNPPCVPSGTGAPWRFCGFRVGVG